MKNRLSWLIYSAAVILFITAGQAKAQGGMTLRGLGSGEKVSIAANGKSKIVHLERDYETDFIGDGAHRYTTLLSIKNGDSFYTVAKFTSSSPITGRNAPCSGDIPLALLLIQANKNLAVEKVQTEVYQSCAFNGSGRELKGKPQITKNKVSINLEEGSKKYVLMFDGNEADKGLQLIKR